MDGQTQWLIEEIANEGGFSRGATAQPAAVAASSRCNTRCARPSCPGYQELKTEGIVVSSWHLSISTCLCLKPPLIIHWSLVLFEFLFELTIVLN